jgi:DnaJ like chaperone protein
MLKSFMYGKILGGVLFGGLGLVLTSSPEISAALAVVGALAGHYAADRRPVAPRARRPLPREAAPSQAGAQQPAPTARQRSVRPSARRETPPADQAKLAKLLAPIFVEVARADGPLSQAEVRVVREFFEKALHFDEAGSAAVRIAVKAADAAPQAPVNKFVKAARAELKPSERLDVVRWLYDLALVDGELTKAEAETLRRAVHTFNLSSPQLQEITRSYFGAGASHCETLGIAESASEEEIRTAFRRLAAEHHPDRSGGQGEAHARAAAARFHEVKEAYDALRKIRGF